MPDISNLMVAPATITVNPRNARVHSDAQIVQIAQSIKEGGFVEPIIVDETLMLIGGEGRLRAALKLGLKQIPAVKVVGLGHAAKAALTLRLNRIALNSAWDIDLLRSEIEMLRESGEDIEGMGFGSKELAKLFEDDDKPIEVKEVPTSDVADRFWIAIRGPLKDQAHALRALDEAMKPFPDVEVELGTVAVD